MVTAPVALVRVQACTPVNVHANSDFQRSGARGAACHDLVSVGRTCQGARSRRRHPM